MHVLLLWQPVQAVSDWEVLLLYISKDHRFPARASSATWLLRLRLGAHKERRTRMPAFHPAFRTLFFKP
jgi:hypothetical protein